MCCLAQIALRSGLPRMKCRAKMDNKVGWVTVVGNGTVLWRRWRLVLLGVGWWGWEMPS